MFRLSSSVTVPVQAVIANIIIMTVRKNSFLEKTRFVSLMIKSDDHCDQLPRWFAFVENLQEISEDLSL